MSIAASAILLVAGCTLPFRDSLDAKIYSSHSEDHTLKVIGYVLEGELADPGPSEDWDFNGSQVFYELEEEVPAPRDPERPTEIDLGEISTVPGLYRFVVTMDGDEPVERRTNWSPRTGPDTLLLDIGSDGTLHVGFLFV